jgi:hypothetical protein
MPKQVRGIQIFDNGKTVTVEIDGYQFEVEKTSLLNSDFNQEQLLHNMRLAFLIGNYGQLNSLEYLDSVNKNGAGLKLTCGTKYINRVENNENGTYTVFVGNKKGSEDYQIELQESQLREDSGDRSAVLHNIKSFLKAEGYTSLSAAAITKLKNQDFWC